jgi:hypothetical protein
MGSYQFTGIDTEVFPSIVTATGSLVCNPGDVVDLDGFDVDHPRLQPVQQLSPDAITATYVNDEPTVDQPAEEPQP